MSGKRIGRQTVRFSQPPCIVSSATIAGGMEEQGPFKHRYDLVLEDDTWGEKSWEKAEEKMFEQAVRIALQKAELQTTQVGCLLGGDLLNQLISANYAARELAMPFLGLYGACSTMTESLLIGSMLVDGGFAQHVACAASSHFSTAERQFRMPLEMGNQTTPTAQRTVTGAGCAILAEAHTAGQQKGPYSKLRISEGTIGKVVDFGITDMNNMGAAMAPAAADTICTHLDDLARTVEDYDLIVTGDLGSFGSQMLYDLCKERGVDLLGKHTDCGILVFGSEQDVDCGGSGCGCSAIVLNSYYLPKMEEGAYRRIMFLSTGALMSPASSMQGESIPGIAHAVVLERSNT